MSMLDSAPASQFTNRYLADSRGFSGFDITVFRGITQGFPGLAGVAIGGRLAETRGRRPVAALALFAGTVAQMVFYLYGSVVLWVSSATADAYTCSRSSLWKRSTSNRLREGSFASTRCR